MTDSPKNDPKATSLTKKAAAKSEPKKARKAASAKPAEPIPNNTRQSSGKGAAIFAILLSLLALGGSGYTWYASNVERVASESDLAVGVTQIGGQVTRLGDTITRLQQRQSDVVTQEQLTTQILQANSAVDLRLRDIIDTQKALTDSVDNLNDSVRKGVNSYVIDEVSQLLKLANNNALFSGDVASAIRALELADIQLKELADPRFSLVRRKINEEIGMLSGIEQVDVERLTAQLQAASNRVPSLRLENERPVMEELVIETEMTDEEQATFRGGVKQFWADLVNSFDIQRIDQPPKPLLAPEQRYFLNQNLQLQLAKAELAVLQQRPQVYAQSLDAALSWTRDYFDLKNEGVQSFIKEIERLKEQPVKVEMPAVSGAYDLLQTIKGGQ